jgi:hypothetical protein
MNLSLLSSGSKSKPTAFLFDLIYYPEDRGVMFFRIIRDVSELHGVSTQNRAFFTNVPVPFVHET